jgi:hypothetical protein
MDFRRSYEIVRIERLNSYLLLWNDLSASAAIRELAARSYFFWGDDGPLRHVSHATVGSSSA